MPEFDPNQRILGCRKCFEPEHGTRHPLHAAMVLLYNIILVVSELMPRPLEVLLNADPFTFTPAVQCGNLPNLYPCLAVERSSPAVSPVSEPRRGCLGYISLPSRLQTLLV